jgi:hypothetical protein
MGSTTQRFGLFKPALSDDSDVIAGISENMEILDEKAALDTDVQNRTVATQEDAYRRSVIINDAGGDGAAIRAASKVTGAVAGLETNMDDDGADFAENGPGEPPEGALAGGYVYSADVTEKARFVLTLDGLKEQLTGGMFRLVRTSVQTVTVPAAAWGADGKATVAVPGMRQNMLQQDFFVTGESKTQAPIRAAAGLGNTDIIPGDGTMTLTAIGVIPTVDLKVIVVIYGREG